MDVQNFCKNYLSGFQELTAKTSTVQTRSLAALKIASYLLVLPFLIAGLTYGITSLVNRNIKPSGSSSPTQEKTGEVFHGVVGNSSSPPVGSSPSPQPSNPDREMYLALVEGGAPQPSVVSPSNKPPHVVTSAGAASPRTTPPPTKDSPPIPSSTAWTPKEVKPIEEVKYDSPLDGTPEKAIQIVRAKIDELAKNNPSEKLKKKLEIFRQCVDQFEIHLGNGKANVEPSFYRLGGDELGALHGDEWLESTIDMPLWHLRQEKRFLPEFYDFTPEKGVDGVVIDDVFVDFANEDLGGGILTHGFVQEEVLAAECFRFLAHLIAHPSTTKLHRPDILTREPVGGGKPSNQPGGGAPNPYLMRGLQRQIATTPSLYGECGETALRFKKDPKSFVFASVQATKQGGFTPEEIREGKALRNIATQGGSELVAIDLVSKLSEPQDLNLIAIAAPKLDDENRETQFSKEVTKDLLRTIVAGMRLVKASAKDKNFRFNSGLLGCGVFHNNPNLVVFLHLLAAPIAGLEFRNLRMWGCDPKKVNIDQVLLLYRKMVNTKGWTIEERLDWVYSNRKDFELLDKEGLAELAART